MRVWMVRVRMPVVMRMPMGMVMIVPMIMVVTVVVVMVVIMAMVMMVIVVVMMVMMVIMIVAMVGHRRERSGQSVAVERREDEAVLAAEFLVAAGAVAIALAGAVFRSAADAFDMVMVARLRQADFRLETERLFAVLAHLAVHQRLAFDDLGEAFV